MDKKAQTMGIVLWVFIGVIVAITLFQAVADQVAMTAIKVTVANKTYTAPAAGGFIDLVGQELLNTPVVTNATGNLDATNLTVPTTNYSIYEGVSTSTGVKTIQYKSLVGPYAGKNVNISYQYGYDGYVEDSGAVAIIGLITIFAALAVAVVALIPTLRNGVIGLIER